MEKIKLKEAFEAGRVYQAMANSTAGILGFNEAPDFNEWYKELVKESDSLPCVRISIPSDKEIEDQGSKYEYEWSEGKTFPNGNQKLLENYANEDFIEGAKWMRSKVQGSES